MESHTDVVLRFLHGRTLLWLCSRSCKECPQAFDKRSDESLDLARLPTGGVFHLHTDRLRSSCSPSRDPLRSLTRNSSKEDPMDLGAEVTVSEDVESDTEWKMSDVDEGELTDTGSDCSTGSSHGDDSDHESPGGTSNLTAQTIKAKFKSIEGCKDKVSCNKCEKVVTCQHGSLTAMRRHLAAHARIESIGCGKEFLGPSVVPLSKRTKDWIIATLVTVLNVSFRSLGHPIFRFIFWLCGLGTINSQIAREATDKECRRVKVVISAELANLKREGAVFTLTVDEWTTQRKRFIGVVFCSSQEIGSLGSKTFELLSRLREQGSAASLFVGIRNALEVFNLSFNDIRGLTSDAASPMILLAKLIAEERAPKTFFHQTCFVHGIHLAVRETLSGKNHDSRTDERQSTTRSGATDEDAAGASRNTEEVPPPEEIEQEIEVCDTGHWLLLRKIRSIGQEFNLSPSKSDKLELICHRTGVKPLKFLHDISTRWDSTFNMLERFLDLEQPLRAYFDQLGQDFPLSDRDMSTIRGIIPALQVVEESRDRLSRDKATLFDAELILEFLFVQLERMNSENAFVAQLLENLEKHITKRRTTVSRLMMYAHTQEKTSALDHRLGKSAQKSATKSIEDELVKFFRETQESDWSDTCEEESPPPDSLTSFDAFLEDFRRSRMSLRTVSPKNVRGKALEQTKLFMRFHESLDRKEALKQFPKILLAVLETIQPTSVSVERTFSKARHCRRYCQQRLNDDRFARKILLKDFYNKTRPWEVFMQSKSSCHKSTAPVILQEDRIVNSDSKSDGQPESSRRQPSVAKGGKRKRTI